MKGGISPSRPSVKGHLLQGRRGGGGGYLIICDASAPLASKTVSLSKGSARRAAADAASAGLPNRMRGHLEMEDAHDVRREQGSDMKGAYLPWKGKEMRLFWRALFVQKGPERDHVVCERPPSQDAADARVAALPLARPVRSVSVWVLHVPG